MIPRRHSISCLQAATLGDGARIARGIGVRVRGTGVLHGAAGKLAGCHDRWAGERRLQPTGLQSITPWG